MHAYTTNLVHIVLERTDDENGYKPTTAHPTISQAHINEFKTKYPKESHKISIARTSNPRILRLLKDTPAYQKLQKEEKEKTILDKVNNLIKPAKTAKKPKPYTDPYRSYAIEESKHKPTMIEHVGTIKDTKPKTSKPKTDEPDFK